MSSAPTTLGYRPLEPQMIELANRNKLIEELVMRQVDAMREDPNLDQRLISIAATHFMEGFMSLNRSVFQPQRIEGTIDIFQLLDGLSQ
jgi:hypothetical protein